MSRKKKIILVVIALILLLPLHIPCGNLYYDCGTAPDPSGTYYTYYELEPLGITVIESFIQKNLHIYYWSGNDAHPIKNS